MGWTWFMGMYIVVFIMNVVIGQFKYEVSDYIS